jgi:hypothetical protein
LSVGIGQDSSKESQDGLTGISGLRCAVCVNLAERVGEALGEDLFSVVRSAWRLWTGNRVGHPVDMTKHPRDVTRMIADVELIFDELNDFVSRPRLTVFE